MNLDKCVRFRITTTFLERLIIRTRYFYQHPGFHLIRKRTKDAIVRSLNAEKSTANASQINLVAV